MAIRYVETEPAKASRVGKAVIRARPSAVASITPPQEPDAAPVITARQIRAGRALLGWTQEQLAERAKVGRATLARIEAELIDPKASTLASIRTALSEAGVRLYDDSDGTGEGARMAKPDDD